MFVNPHSSASTRQVEHNLWARADAVVQDPYAYRVLTKCDPVRNEFYILQQDDPYDVQTSEICCLECELESDS